LIAIVPMAALIAGLLFLSEDSQRGKADARLAAGLKTAIAVYQERIDDAGAGARRLARDPALATSLRGDPAGLQAWARRAAGGSGVVRVEVFHRAGAEIATAGDPNSVATTLGERLGQRMRETEVSLRDGGSIGVTISVGVATLPDSADSLESMVDAADRALLRAKRAGKNQLRTAPVTKAKPSVDQPRHRRETGRRATRRR
jgi:Diguanylate cyclase, GGDEF domain